HEAVALVLGLAPVAGYYVPLPSLRPPDPFFEVPLALREEGHPPPPAALQVLLLGGTDQHPRALPVDVFPAQVEVLTRAAQAGETAEREDQPPLVVSAGV